jgi:Lar family restriction alleviation protein
MAVKLRPCPFCGRTPMLVECATHYFVRCPSNCCEQSIFYEDKNDAIEAWNRRTSVKVEIGFYDQEEVFHNCTVQVLTNTATGETSVGWWKNEV